MLSVEKCRALLPNCALTDDEIARLRDQLTKLAHVALDLESDRLSTDSGPSPACLNDVAQNLSQDEREELEERAGIIEFDAGRSRDEAERRALHAHCNAGRLTPGRKRAH